MQIRTKRLTLSKFTINDAPFFCDLVNDPDWIKHIGDRNIKTNKDAEEYLKKNIIPSYKKDGFGFYVVRLTEENTPIGMCGLIKRDWMDYVEIGYAFLTQFRGKGYAIESSIATKKHAKTTLKISTLAAITDLDNEKSGNLLNRLGFKFSKLISYPGEDKKCKLYLEDYLTSNEVN
jgi:[ribosomal protein S5]-alanine N-acetyltransferase